MCVLAMGNPSETYSTEKDILAESVQMKVWVGAGVPEAE